MKQMDSDTAMLIIHMYTGKDQYTEDEAAEFSEALEYMLDHDFMCPEAWMFNLGDFYRRIGKYDLAVKYFRMCLNEDSNVAYIGLGDTYREMKEYDKAFEYYTKAAGKGYKQAYSRIEAMRREEGSNGTG